MGYYTATRINLRLSKNTPEDVVRVLKAMAKGEAVEDPPDHRLFKTERYLQLLRNKHYRCVYNTYDWGEDPHYEIDSFCEIKNYDHEIENFCEWIELWVDCGVVVARGEDSHIPWIPLAVNVLKERTIENRK